MSTIGKPAYLYAWEYDVDPAKTAEFLAAYAPEGAWAALFRRAPGYIRTELLRDRENANRYVTLDYLESEPAWQAFRKAYAAEFEALDRRCQALSLAEREIGHFNLTDPQAG
jgi:heme-degrading monooxygenase HmoA